MCYFAFEIHYVALAGQELNLCNKLALNLEQFCFCLLNSGIAGMPHHTWLFKGGVVGFREVTHSTGHRLPRTVTRSGPELLRAPTSPGSSGTCL